jgi:hypothetical protein
MKEPKYLTRDGKRYILLARHGRYIWDFLTSHNIVQQMNSMGGDAFLKVVDKKGYLVYYRKKR